MDAAASTIIRYRLQWELDWQILEGAKIGGAASGARFSVRESHYTSDFAYLVPRFYRSSARDIARPIDCRRVRRPGCAQLLAEIC